MRIFSNFDTKLKKRSFIRYQEKYWPDMVVLVVKGRLFWFMKIFFPFFVFVVSSLGILLMFNLFLWTSGAFYGGIPLVVLWFLLVLGPLLKRQIEYKMDFTVVTPKMLITYDQQWLFHRDIKTINTDNIKTVTVEKSGFRYSLFNTGDLTFLSEWDMEHWEVRLHYISKPEKHRHAIAKILGRG